MNDRLSLQDLIDLLAQKQGITKKDAETFLREFIALISENIESNEPVKIKDFGTFKLIKVNARKSVDVNTGEAIEIPAHYKLSFTPDKSLKDAINRPFAHFESVVLEDGVSFDNIEKEDTADESEEFVAEDEVTIVPPPSLVDIQETEEIQEEILESPINESSENVVVEQQREEAEFVEELELEKQSQEEEIIEAETTEPTVPAKEESEGDEDDEYIRYLRDSAKRRRKYFTLGFFIFLILAGFAVGAYYFQEIASYLTDGPKPDKDPIVAVVDSVKTDEVVNKSDSATIALTDTTKTDSVKVAEPTKESLVDVNKPIGTETIKSGQTLRLISLKYYGHKSFWVYIYQENKALIKNPNNVPIGTKLIIPAPAKYGIDAKNSAVVEKAKAAESKLIRELGL